MSTDTRFDGPGPDATWLAALRDGRFTLQRCDDCDAQRFPPALVCRACGSPRLRWVAAPDRATVHATTVVRDRAGDRNVVLVDLGGGARMMSRVDGIAPDAVRIGQTVSPRVVGGDEPHVVFDPADGDAGARTGSPA